MRTTANLDDDILIAVQTLARASGKTLGQVLSELARRSLQGSAPETSKAIPRFQVSPHTPKISLDAIRRAWLKETESMYLLDVNVLLALVWPNHPFHEIARTWFSRIGPQGLGHLPADVKRVCPIIL